MQNARDLALVLWAPVLFVGLTLGRLGGAFVVPGLALCIVGAYLALRLGHALVERQRWERLATKRRRAFLGERRETLRLRVELAELRGALVPDGRTLLVGPYLPEGTRAYLMGLLARLGAERAASVPELQRIWDRGGVGYVDGRLNPEAYELFTATFAARDAARSTRAQELSLPPRGGRARAPEPMAVPTPPPAPAERAGRHAAEARPAPSLPRWDGLRRDTVRRVDDADRKELARLLRRAEHDLADVDVPQAGPLTMAEL